MNEEGLPVPGPVPGLPVPGLRVPVGACLAGRSRACKRTVDADGTVQRLVAGGHDLLVPRARVVSRDGRAVTEDDRADGP